MQKPFLSLSITICMLCLFTMASCSAVEAPLPVAGRT